MNRRLFMGLTLSAVAASGATFDKPEILEVKCGTRPDHFSSYAYVRFKYKNKDNDIGLFFDESICNRKAEEMLNAKLKQYGLKCKLPEEV